MDRFELRTMKKRLPAMLLAIAFLACLFPFSAPAANAAGVAIRLEPGPDAGEAEQAVAAVLQDYLEKITGTRPSLTAADIQGQKITLRLNRDGQEQKKGAYDLRGDGAVFTIEAADNAACGTAFTAFCGACAAGKCIPPT